jgi:hypothetical protein
MPQKRSNEFLCQLTTPPYFFTPLNKTGSRNSGASKRNVPISKTIRPKGKEGLLTTNDFNSFYLRLKGRVLFGSTFSCKYAISKQRDGPIKGWRA